MKLKCPICKKDVALGEPDFPFCSERCRLIDLGRWAAEEYRIPVVGDPLQPEIDEEAE
jgi:endogenous inhibitor of DNA gyrase (YacG/DUF329 family)